MIVNELVQVCTLGQNGLIGGRGAKAGKPLVSRARSRGHGKAASALLSQFVSTARRLAKNLNDSKRYMNREMSSSIIVQHRHI